MGDSSSPTVTQTSRVQLSPQQQELYDLAFPFAQQYASTPIQQFQGSGIAGFTPLQLQAQSDLVNNAAGTAGGLAEQSAAAHGMMLDPSFMLDVANNPYIQAIQSSITNNATQNLQEKILPGLRSGATQASGMYSGASTKNALSEGKAVGDTGEAIGDATAKLFFDAYNRGLTGMQQAVGQTGAVQAQQLFAPGILDAVGTQQQGMEQALLDEQIRNFYVGQQLPLTQAQELMALVAGMPGATTVGQTTGAVPSPSGVQQGAGILMTLLGLL